MRPRWAQERHTHTGLVGGGDGFLPVKDSLRFQARASTAGGDSLEVTSGTGTGLTGTVAYSVASNPNAEIREGGITICGWATFPFPRETTAGRRCMSPDIEAEFP